MTSAGAANARTAPVAPMAMTRGATLIRSARESSKHARTQATQESPSIM